MKYSSTVLKLNNTVELKVICCKERCEFNHSNKHEQFNDTSTRFELRALETALKCVEI